MIVAVDGPAGVGKSTVSRRVAEHLGMHYLNSGNVYRAVTLAVQQAGADPSDTQEVLRIARHASITLAEGRINLHGRDVEELLHTDEVDAWVAQHSAVVAIRHLVNDILRSVARGLSAVVEGRDIATVVFPNAEVKVYLDARVRVRAERRFRQGTSSQSLEELEASITARDKIDRNKEEGSLRIAEGAVCIDTSDLTIEQVCATVERHIHESESKHTSGSRVLVMVEPEGNGKRAFDQSVLQEQYLKNLDHLVEGQLIQGTVVQVADETVFVDVGYKSEGRIPATEFDDSPSVGDAVHVVLVSREGKGGQVVVSKRQADEKIFWRNLRIAHSEGKPIEGTFFRSIKGGFEVDMGYDVRGFCPLSKTDVFRVETPEEYVGKRAKFLIDRLYSENKLKIVLSRRAWLEKEIQRRRDGFFETTQIGDEVQGVVKSFTSFGAFIDLGGFDGLLHINDMSWGHVTRPKDYVTKGDDIALKVIRLDHKERKINLSLKHFTADPWTTFEDRFAVDDVVKGSVTKLTDFGAFIEIEEGIEGLAHISELSWVKRIRHPSEVLKVGDEVEAKILSYDIQQGRISLGLKQVYPNPWDSIDLRYPVGAHLSKPVRKLTNAGAFVELDEGIDGFLHVEDMSWTKRIRNPSSVVSEGENVAVVIIEIDKESRRIRLGMKQLTDDPWQALASSYPKGSVIEGTVTSKTDFGIFVKVQDDIEGLVPKQHVAEPDAESPDEAFEKCKEGEVVKAIVTDVNPQKQRLSLSFREYQKNLQRVELSKYIHQESDNEAKVALGDFLKEKENGAVEP